MRYDKPKTPIVFGVGGVIVAMETIFIDDFLVSALSAAVLLGLSSNSCVMVKQRRQTFLVWAESSLPW